MGTYKGHAGNDTMFGSAKADYMFGYGGADVIHGLGGDDQIYGGDGSDTLFGDAGNDSLYGEAGDDHIYGGDGDDGLSGGEGDDVLEGGAGNDGLNGGAGADTLLGGDGNDYLGISTGNDMLTGGAGIDTFRIAQESDQGGNGLTTVTDFTVGVDVLVGESHWDANPNLPGEQRWEYVGAAPLSSPLADGNGQATVNFENGSTVLRLYNNDGNLSADLVLAFQGTYSPQDLQIHLRDAVTGQYTDAAILF